MPAKQILAALALMTIPVLRMEKQFPEWVQNTRTVTVVEPPKKTYQQKSYQLPIDNSTTIGGLKTELSHHIKVPASQQVLRPITKSWRTCGFTSMGRPLDDAANVKSVVQYHNTTKFALRSTK